MTPPSHIVHTKRFVSQISAIAAKKAHCDGLKMMHGISNNGTIASTLTATLTQSDVTTDLQLSPIEGESHGWAIEGSRGDKIKYVVSCSTSKRSTKSKFSTSMQSLMDGSEFMMMNNSCWHDLDGTSVKGGTSNKTGSVSTTVREAKPGPKTEDSTGFFGECGHACNVLHHKKKITAIEPYKTYHSASNLMDGLKGGDLHSSLHLLKMEATAVLENHQAGGHFSCPLLSAEWSKCHDESATSVRRKKANHTGRKEKTLLPPVVTDINMTTSAGDMEYGSCHRAHMTKPKDGEKKKRRSARHNGNPPNDEGMGNQYNRAYRRASEPILSTDMSEIEGARLLLQPDTAAEHIFDSTLKTHTSRRRRLAEAGGRRRQSSSTARQDAHTVPFPESEITTRRYHSLSKRRNKSARRVSKTRACATPLSQNADLQNSLYSSMPSLSYFEQEAATEKNNTTQNSHTSTVPQERARIKSSLFISLDKPDGQPEVEKLHLRTKYSGEIEGSYGHKAIVRSKMQRRNSAPMIVSFEKIKQMKEKRSADYDTEEAILKANSPCAADVIKRQWPAAGRLHASLSSLFETENLHKFAEVKTEEAELLRGDGPTTTTVLSGMLQKVRLELDQELSTTKSTRY